MKHHMLFGELAQGVPLSTSGQYPFQLFLQSQTCTPPTTHPLPPDLMAHLPMARHTLTGIINQLLS